MAFKLLIMSALMAAVQAGVVPSSISYSTGISHSAAAPLAYASPAITHAYAAPAAPIAYAAKAIHVEEPYDPNPQYSYAYDVHDGHTGDAKSQHETRQGDVVQGEYSLIEPDGTRRVVQYTADPHNGFNAVVHREPAHHPQVVTKTIAAAPVLSHAGPITYAAPAAYVH